jgi:hypothetical protein
MHRTLLSGFLVALLLGTASGCGDSGPKIIMPTAHAPPLPPIQGAGGGGAPPKKEPSQEQGEPLGQPTPEPVRAPG